MSSTLSDHVRHGLRDPRWAARSLTTRMQIQRFLGWEPAEFRRIAKEYLYSGQVGGWRYRQDLVVLYLLARDVPGTGVTLEIGSYEGLGTIALAYGVRAGDKEPVFTVDPHLGHRQDLDEDNRKQASSLENFQKNMVFAGIQDEVTSYTMTSEALASQWSGDKIRVLFIDGWHSYDACMTDLQKWAPLVEPSGVILFDDYGNYEGVRDAVRDAGDLVPPLQRAAGRMWLASHDPLSADLQRFLRIPWG